MRWERTRRSAVQMSWTLGAYEGGLLVRAVGSSAVGVCGWWARGRADIAPRGAAELPDHTGLASASGHDAPIDTFRRQVQARL